MKTNKATGGWLTTWREKLTLSLSAFIMSLAATLLNAFTALRGSELTVRPPEAVLAFRDGDDLNSPPSLAFQVTLLNSTSDYSDVLVDSRLELPKIGVHFSAESIINPVFLHSATEGAAQKCATGASCLSFKQLNIAYESETMVSLPGGAFRRPYLTFPITGSNCFGGEGACKPFERPADTLRVLGISGRDIVIRLRFQSDGSRKVSCQMPKLDLAHYRAVGWQNLPCTILDAA